MGLELKKITRLTRTHMCREKFKSVDETNKKKRKTKRIITILFHRLDSSSIAFTTATYVTIYNFLYLQSSKVPHQVARYSQGPNIYGKN